MFFLEKKSQSLIFQENFSLYIWYISVYKNDTFPKIAREVLSKYHKTGRSIIKKRQTAYKTSETAYKTSEISNEMHQLCPRTWLLVPTYMGTSDQYDGYPCPKLWVTMPYIVGHECPKAWASLGKSIYKETCPNSIDVYSFLKLER